MSDNPTWYLKENNTWYQILNWEGFIPLVQEYRKKLKIPADGLVLSEINNYLKLGDEKCPTEEMPKHPIIIDFIKLIEARFPLTESIESALPFILVFGDDACMPYGDIEGAKFTRVYKKNIKK